MRRHRLRWYWFRILIFILMIKVEAYHVHNIYFHHIYKLFNWIFCSDSEEAKIKNRLLYEYFRLQIAQNYNKSSPIKYSFSTSYPTTASWLNTKSAKFIFFPFYSKIHRKCSHFDHHIHILIENDKNSRWCTSSTSLKKFIWNFSKIRDFDKK